MKTIPILLENHMQAGTTTLAHLLKITRTDSAVFAFTSHVDDVTIDSVDYISAQGLNVSRIENTAGLAVDNLELTTLDDGTLFTHVDVLGGVWKNAKFEIFRYNYNTPSDGLETMMTGMIGEVRLNNGHVVMEMRGLQQFLQQPVGSVMSKTCRARLGDAGCTVDLTPFTYTGTITGVTSSQVFADSSRTEADDWFGYGLLTFTSGPLTGLTQKVKSWTLSTKTFMLVLPMFRQVTVGTTYTVIAGCRKRLMEDCVAKYGNAINFQGEPHVPGLDEMVKSPL